MKKIILSFSALVLALIAKPVLAVCPVCTIAVVGGVGLSRWLGIDDTVTGLWIGGLVVSLIIWTVDWLNRKKIKFIGRKITVALIYYLIVVAPLYWYEIIGHPLNKLWGIDKLMLGIALGSIFFFLGALSYPYIKKKNNDKAHFPYQKVIMPILPIIILSVIFYFLTR